MSRRERQRLKTTDKREHLPGDKGAPARRGKTYVRMKREDGNPPACSRSSGWDMTSPRGRWDRARAPWPCLPLARPPLDTGAFLCPNVPWKGRPPPHPDSETPVSSHLIHVPSLSATTMPRSRGGSQQVPLRREAPIRTRVRGTEDRDSSLHRGFGAVSF